jgi:DNA modification methylase
MEWCLNDLPEGSHVVDPFLGSGTTGIACLNAHMNFTGIEITPDYLPIADARVRHWNSERSILEGRAVIVSDCDTTPKQRDVDFDDFFGLDE